MLLSKEEAKNMRTTRPSLGQAKTLKRTQAIVDVCVGYLAANGEPAIYTIENVNIKGIYKVPGSGYIVLFSGERSVNLGEIMQIIPR